MSELDASSDGDTSNSPPAGRGPGAQAVPAPAPAPASAPTPPKVQMCDLVMKGGITSGIIYPKLISALAARYHFKNIGGTSAGAIAAGACAAAEYGRQHGNANAFKDLEQLPQTLSASTKPSGRSRLFTLFQPSEALRRHFSVLVGTLNSDTPTKIRRVLLGLLGMHWLLTAASMALGSLVLSPLVAGLCIQASYAEAVAFALLMLLIALAGSLLVVAMPRGPFGVLRWTAVIAVVLAPMAALWLSGYAVLDFRLVGYGLATEFLAVLLIGTLLGLVAWRFVSTLLVGLHKNGYGICSGQTVPIGSSLTGLTDWLTVYFNELAGIPQRSHPLTFGDLWGNPARDLRDPRDINLEVMTTAVSQSMGYSIPFREGTQRLYYDPAEWERYFPKSVMDWLKDAEQACPQGDSKEPFRPNERIVSAEGVVLRALPRAADLPVVVAIRMSLSFPILLSAVPLYSLDWTRKATQTQDKKLDALAKLGDTTTKVDLEATRVWFSDGGISSNMPLHFFDALLPEHPTYAINLKDEHPDFKIKNFNDPENDGGRIYLATNNGAGRLRYWAAPADKTATGGLAGFLLAIVNTMQNWRDELLFPYPGFRDRIVQISQRPDEGGLNLDMPKENIDHLSDAGAMAAQRLVERFSPVDGKDAAGWVNHQKVRLRTFLGVMQPAAAQMNASLESGHWWKLAQDLPMTKDQKCLSNAFLGRLEELSALGKGTTVSLESVAMKPVAQVRITPRI